MHFRHLDHLYPHFESLVDAYLKECPIDFENPGEAVVTCLVDSMADEQFTAELKGLAVSLLTDLRKEKENELGDLISTLIGNLNLLGSKENKEKIEASLPAEVRRLWTTLDHNQIEA